MPGTFRAFDLRFAGSLPKLASPLVMDLVTAVLQPCDACR